MPRGLFSLLLSLGAVGILGASAGARPADSPSIDGTWLIDKAELAGRAMPAEFIQTTTLTIKGGQYTVMVGEAADRGTIRHDAGKSPKTMDITGVEGPNQGKTLQAIYDWDGAKLRICYNLAGEPRPSEFASKPGTQLFLVTYRRK